NAVWVDEVPLVIRRVAAGAEQMEVGINAAAPSIGSGVVGAVAPPWSCFTGVSDNGAGGNRLVEKGHIDLVRVGPPEFGIRVVRSTFGAPGLLEELLVLRKSRLFESRNSDVPGIVGVVCRTVAKVHVNGSEGILHAG